MPAEIREFFDSYRDAFNRLDGRAVSAHYDLPAMIVHAGGNGVFMDADALNANNVALCEQYSQSGFVSADYVAGAFLPQGDEFCVADLTWTIIRRDQPQQQFNTSYSLAKRNQQWKIAAVTAYQERRAWREHE
jgi:ketosteroid isomerase-like protein